MRTIMFSLVRFGDKRNPSDPLDKAKIAALAFREGLDRPRKQNYLCMSGLTGTLCVYEGESDSIAFSTHSANNSEGAIFTVSSPTQHRSLQLVEAITRMFPSYEVGGYEGHPIR